MPMNPYFEEITFRNVGFIGWPNVGKSSIINSIQEISNVIQQNYNESELNDEINKNEHQNNDEIPINDNQQLNDDKVMNNNLLKFKHQ
jgi:ribosome biogenesis GTPase A